MERVKSGITGLDDSRRRDSRVFFLELSWGREQEKQSLQCNIYTEALWKIKPGLFVTLETNLKEYCMWNMESFRWDIRSLQEKNMMRIYRLNLSDTSDTKKCRKNR